MWSSINLGTTEVSHSHIRKNEFKLSKKTNGERERKEKGHEKEIFTVLLTVREKYMLN